MKKKNKRNNTKYPALNPSLNLKTRTDLLDYDYLDKLSDKEKEWLNRFTEEYTHAKFNHKGKRIQKSKEQVKDSYDRNNSRNRDILTRVRASGRLKDIETIKGRDMNIMNPEEELILKEEINERLKRRRKKS